RNGLRPARYFVTRDERIIMASEMGVLSIPEKDIVTKWRLQPGKMLLVDLDQSRLLPHEELTAQLAQSPPHQERLPRPPPPPPRRGGRGLRFSRRPFHNGPSAIPRKFGAPCCRRGDPGGGGGWVPWATPRRSRRCPTSPSSCSLFSSRPSRKCPTRRSIRS